MTASDLLRATLQAMDTEPRPLEASLDAMAQIKGAPRNLCDLSALRKALSSDDPNDPILLALSQAVPRWEYEASTEWTDGTPRNSPARRDLIFFRLQLPAEVRKLYDARFKLSIVDRPTVIAKGHSRWYSTEQTGDFYWRAYTRQLEAVARWPGDSIAALSDSTTAIVERLAAPGQEAAYQSKGLVVGYVQSGKTANFTGVLARAADAGYRLFIVLAGVLDVLRNQTQRRIDKELIGRELIEHLGMASEYASDSEWDSFNRHGGLPSELGSFDWVRLTGATVDYRSLAFGLSVLDFKSEATDPGLPLNAPENLRRMRARIIVVKKNASVLKKLHDDLKAAAGRGLREIPALIIDDESDQGSINTRKPDRGSSEWRQEEERTRINQRINDLLKLMPRCQYVGYTATPFANVFVNPADHTDIFPKDFIISLPRPTDYMGVSDFFDVQDEVGAADPAVSNEAAFVRDVRGDDEEAANLPLAIDSFVLSGALKLYRRARGVGLNVRHHTMLVHSSAFKKAHAQDARFVEKIYRSAEFGSAAAHRRLARLLESDFRPVSIARASDLAFPRTYAEIEPHVNECVSRIDSVKAVRIVNGDNRDDTPDFEAGPVWAILVGGTKLSRGYTVEGLTTSYYRRRAATADTLMQMGRWFGFRRGYRDVVRLFVGREEPAGGPRRSATKKGSGTGSRKKPVARTLDLLEAFKAICMDEEEFRKELKRYADLDAGITPKDVPPLVPFHMLQPTARNKMRWARIASQNLGGAWSEKTTAPEEPELVKRNLLAAARLVEKAAVELEELEVRHGDRNVKVSALAGTVPSSVVSRFLAEYRWPKGMEGMLTRERDYLEGKAGDPAIERWVILAPQLTRPTDDHWTPGQLKLTVKERARIQSDGKSSRFKVYSEPQHRTVAECLAGLSDARPVSRAARELGSARGTAVMLLYPVRAPDDDFISIGFALLFPRNEIRTPLRYVVDDPSRMSGESD